MTTARKMIQTDRLRQAGKMEPGETRRRFGEGDLTAPPPLFRLSTDGSQDLNDKSQDGKAAEDGKK
jgi:hypothetical protein